MTRLHFLKENIPGSATTALTLVPYAGTEFFAQKSGHVSRLTAFLTEARTAGTLTFKVTKNGTAQSAVNATIDANATQYDEVFGDSDDLTFLAGDRIGVQVVSASFTPTTSDAVAVLDLSESM